MFFTILHRKRNIFVLIVVNEKTLLLLLLLLLCVFVGSSRDCALCSCCCCGIENVPGSSDVNMRSTVDGNPVCATDGGATQSCKLSFQLRWDYEEDLRVTIQRWLVCESEGVNKHHLQKCVSMINANLCCRGYLGIIFMLLQLSGPPYRPPAIPVQFRVDQVLSVVHLVNDYVDVAYIKSQASSVMHEWTCAVSTSEFGANDKSVSCDRCLLWLHFSCANLKRAPAKKEWFCKQCRQAAA